MQRFHKANLPDLEEPVLMADGGEKNIGPAIIVAIIFLLAGPASS